MVRTIDCGSKDFGSIPNKHPSHNINGLVAK